MICENWRCQKSKYFCSEWLVTALFSAIHRPAANCKSRRKQAARRAWNFAKPRSRWCVHAASQTLRRKFFLREKTSRACDKDDGQFRFRRCSKSLMRRELLNAPRTARGPLRRARGILFVFFKGDFEPPKRPQNAHVVDAKMLCHFFESG